MLALTRSREVSTLDEEVDSERLDVWFALILEFTRLREASMLEEESTREMLEV
jgi:hypothetical protein